MCLWKQPESAYKRKEYKISKSIGKGSFSVVTEAVDLKTGQKVAIKRIAKGTREKQEMFHLETLILQGIKHSNIVSLLDYFETRNKYYLVFELATGGNLLQRLEQQGKFSEKDTKTLIFSLLDALQLLHSRRIVHRDLKPENILFKVNGHEPMIADFGVSQIAKDSKIFLIGGSPSYAAPEVIQRTGHTTSADIWSIGVLCFTVIAGYHPFNYCTSLPELLDAICTGKYEFKSPFWDGISKEAQDFISALMTVDADQRPTAEQCKQLSWFKS